MLLCLLEHIGRKLILAMWRMNCVIEITGLRHADA
jgi:hypothetical protein